MPSVNNYKTPFMLKMHLIIFTSMCIFIGLLYDCIQNLINKILTWLIRLNIGVLIFAINNYLIKCLLFFSVITTPYVLINNKSIEMKPSFINKDLWVFLTTIILLWFYNENIHFKNNNSFIHVLISLIIPCIFHFMNDKYFESRAMLLCLTMIFDIFNHNKSLSQILNIVSY
jgi:hypothetical protein